MSEAPEGECFSLRWNNFHSNLSTGFHALLEDEDFVDVTLAVEGKVLQAHKIVLSICSPYFKELFKVNPCKHPIVILKDVKYKEMLGLLQFMYKGEVNIAQDLLPDFLRAAELLHIKGLTGNEPEDSKSISRRELRPESSTPSKRPPAKRIKTDQPPLLVSCVGEGAGNSDHHIKPLIIPKAEPPDFSDCSETYSENSSSTIEPEICYRESLTGTKMTPLSLGNLAVTEGKDVQGRFSCEQCDKSFSRRDNLQTHISDIHGEGRGPFACPICNKFAKNKTSLRSHIYTNHRRIQYSTEVKAAFNLDVPNVLT